MTSSVYNSRLHFLLKRGGIIIILLAALFVYYPVLQSEFLIPGDDITQIINNENIHALTWENIKTIFTSPIISSYQPLMQLSYAFEYALVETEPFLYHLTNVLLHLLNVVLVYLFLRKIPFVDQTKGLLITAIFALHPLQVETIAWIAARSNLFFLAFILLASMKYIDFIQHHKLKDYLWSLFFFIFTLLSKSTAIIFPFLIILYYYFFQNKKHHKDIRKVVIEIIPFLVLSFLLGLYSLGTRSVDYFETFFNNMLNYEWYDKMFISVYSLWFYIYKFFYPVDLYFSYGYPIKYIYNNFTLPIIFRLSPFIIISILAGVFLLLKKYKRIRVPVIFGLLFFGINIFLILNISTYLSTITADRYMYLAIVGIGIVFVVVGAHFFKINKQKKVGYSMLIVILVLLAFKSRNQTLIWRDSFTLYSHAVNHYIKKGKEDYYVHGTWEFMHNLYQSKKDMNDPNYTKEMIDFYTSAINIKKNEPIFYLFRGIINTQAQDYVSAVNDFDSILNSRNIIYKSEVRLSAFKERVKIRAAAGMQFKSPQYLTLALMDVDSILSYDSSNIEYLNLKGELQKNLSTMSK